MTAAHRNCGSHRLHTQAATHLLIRAALAQLVVQRSGQHLAAHGRRTPRQLILRSLALQARRLRLWASRWVLQVRQIGSVDLAVN